MFLVILMSWLLVVSVDLAFVFAQVLLILRSQVGLTHCARFILWSELRFWPPLLIIIFYFLMFFPYLFCSSDRLRQKLRHMDFDTFLRVQFEHHSLVSFELASFSFVFFYSEV